MSPALKDKDAAALPAGMEEAMAQVEAHVVQDEATWAKRITPGGDLYQEVYVGAATLKTASAEYGETLRKVRSAFVLQGVEDRFVPWAEQASGLSPASITSLIRAADVYLSAEENSPIRDVSYSIRMQLARVPAESRIDALVQAGGSEGASFSSVKDAVDKILEAAKPEESAKARRERITKLATKMTDDFRKVIKEIDNIEELAFVGKLLQQGADLQREYKSDYVSEAIKLLTTDAVQDLKVKLVEAAA